MDENQLRELIKQVLTDCNLYSKEAEQLILATGLAESNLKYIRQVKGPALGLFQMEKRTHDDIWDNYLKYRKHITDHVNCYSVTLCADELVYNIAYAILMCRIHYLRVSEPLPKASDVLWVARYWKKYYNTELGKGTIEGFVAKTSKIF